MGWKVGMRINIGFSLLYPSGVLGAGLYQTSHQQCFSKVLLSSANPSWELSIWALGMVLLPCQAMKTESLHVSPRQLQSSKWRAAGAAGPWHFFCTFFQPPSCRASAAFRKGKKAVTLRVLQSTKPPSGERRDGTALASVSYMCYYLRFSLSPMEAVICFSVLISLCTQLPLLLKTAFPRSSGPRGSFFFLWNYRCHKHLQHGAWFLIQRQTSWGGKQVFRSISSPGDMSIGHTRMPVISQTRHWMSPALHWKCRGGSRYLAVKTSSLKAQLAKRSVGRAWINKDHWARIQQRRP